MRAALAIGLAGLAAVGAASATSGGTLRAAAVTAVAAGDIASCSSPGDEATARLLDRVRGTILALGDTVYEHGTPREYARCYAPSWGRHRARTRPAVGNHEYGTAGASGYFGYFGARAGPRRGHHSYSLGAWHMVVLNSNCAAAGGCGIRSPQARWLAAALAAHRSRCTLAYMHHPRFSSGLHGSDETLTHLWRVLYAGGADVVLAGHDHHYERFAPQTPSGRRDRVRGIRQFVVGTGGRSLYPILRRLPNSEAAQTRTFGVLVLRLLPDGYRWRFVAVPGSTYRDSGSGRCNPL